MTTTTGLFQVSDDGSFSGPAAYLHSEWFDKSRIADSAALLGSAAPSPISVASAIGIALQTDYAAWEGQRSLGR
jgi:hypothetical protein